MKQKMKFFALVFGVALAMFGSSTVSAAKGGTNTTQSYTCVGSTGTCATVENPAGQTTTLKGTKKSTSIDPFAG